MGNCNGTEMSINANNDIQNNNNFNRNGESENNNENFFKLQRDDFIFEKPIGKGGFGKVWQVVRKKDGKMFAMKEMLKARVLAKRSIHSVINERKILSQLKHLFIVNM